MCKVKEFIASLSETTTITKRELFFAALTCIFGGMVVGMFCSPKKRTMIGSHNGNNNGNNNGWDDDEMWEEECPEEDSDILSFN